MVMAQGLVEIHGWGFDPAILIPQVVPQAKAPANNGELMAAGQPP
jgi:hypothetical protein